jgi:ABC-type polysaccharide/polyol phosphate export permease
MQAFLTICFAVCVLLAVSLIFAGQTDIHLGFAGVIFALGAVCFGLGAVLGAMNQIWRELRAQYVFPDRKPPAQ